MIFANEQVKTEFGKYEQKIGKAIDHLKGELTSVRAGRANPQILNRITLDYYGTPTPLTQIANISVPEARMLTISLYDVSMVKEAVKAIQASDIGISPSDDGRIIRLVFPQLNAERRQELTKQIKRIAEDSKVVLRNERRDLLEVLKKFKKDNIISEDEEKTCAGEVQKILDKNIELIDKLYKEKEAEILEV